MFVVTFYSYKGGVGRSLALANVAAELAQRGKSVLVVDFDLEAPGVTSFDFGGDNINAVETPGLIDFIASWLEYGRSPNAQDFVHVCQSRNEKGGAISIMSAGKVDESYGSRLSQIDFSDLYENHRGFLLFEDLRAQWKTLGFDYVLIDSRTGHTDVAGVCTRQLPDLVVFVFWPNDQNLHGLMLISQEMKTERSNSPIMSLFVPSNLPTLDDENGILKKRLATFRTRLDYGGDREIQIQNYPSLDLLDQTLFTVSRKASRLGRSYRNLTDAVQRSNSADEEGVRLFLVREITKDRSARSDSTNEFMGAASENNVWSFEALSARGWRDPEIYRLLAGSASLHGNPFGTIKMIKELVRLGVDDLADNLALAQMASYTGEHLDTLAVATRLLNDPKADQQHVVAAINLIVADEVALKIFDQDIGDHPGFKNLTLRQLMTVADLCKTNRLKTKLIASAINSLALRTVDFGAAEHDKVRIVELCLPLIAAGYFMTAAEILSKIVAIPGVRTIRAIYNFAMAEWGVNGSAPLELLYEVIAMHEANASAPNDNANYDQCIAIAYTEVDQQANALAALKQSRKNSSHSSQIFSGWTYLSESESVFSSHLDQLEKRIYTGSPMPTFLTGD